MDLFRKLRTLLGAWAHKPFAPEPPRAEPKQGAGHPEGVHAAPNRPALQQQDDEAPEEGRVADLIERRKHALGQSEGRKGADRASPTEP
jgi:hypothetical protein